MNITTISPMGEGKNNMFINDEMPTVTVGQQTAIADALTSSEQLHTDAPTLASSAMLVEVNISSWAGRKKDKRASTKVTEDAQAKKGVANVYKQLLGDCDELSALRGHVTAARNMHSNMTMPWSNSGLRLLPTAQYFKYTEAMSQMQNEFESLKNKFLTAYNDTVVDVQLELGTLFLREDYPTVESLNSKFAFRINYMPLPDVGDFRVDVSNDALREMRKEYSDFYSKQFNVAMNDVWTRLHKALTNMSERLDYSGKEDKKVFRDTLVPNVTDMIELLRVCNVTQSIQMSDMANKLEDAMSGVSAVVLRDDNTFRVRTKAKVDDIIKTLPSLDI